MLARVLVLSVVPAFLACHRVPAANPPPARPAARGGAVELARFIPADSGFAMFVERGMFDNPFAGTVNEPARRKLATALETAATAEASTAGDRFWREIARALGDLDAASLAEVGWLPGKSTMALYTVGLVPVLRVHLDGVKAEGVLRIAARTSGVTLTEGKWKGKVYLSYRDDDEVQVLIASAPDQLVIALAAEPEAVLDHLTTFAAPAGDSLATSWDHGGATRFLFVDPARLATQITDPRALARVAGAKASEAEPGCLAAVARTVAEVPRTSWTFTVGKQNVEWNLSFDLAAETVALLKGGQMPGWTNERDVAALRFGLGVAPYPLLKRTGGLMSAISAASQACGSDGDDSFATALAQLAPLQMVQGATLEMVALDGRQITMSVALAVRDVPAMWTLLSSFLPGLGSTIPAIGDVRDLSASGMPVFLGVGRNLLIGSMGGHPERRVRAMLGAAPGPRMPFAARFDVAFLEPYQQNKLTFLGQPMNDDDPSQMAGDTLLDSRLDGNRLVIRMGMGPRTGD